MLPFPRFINTPCIYIKDIQKGLFVVNNITEALVSICLALYNMEIIEVL